MHFDGVHRRAGSLEGVNIDDPRAREGPRDMVQHGVVKITFDLVHAEAVHFWDVSASRVEVSDKGPVPIVIHHLHHLPSLDRQLIADRRCKAL